MPSLKNGTMVVVADSEKVLFLVNLTDAEDPNLEVVRKDEEDNPPDREQTENRRGRVQERIFMSCKRSGLRAIWPRSFT